MQAVSCALERYVTAVRELSDNWIPVQAHSKKLILERFTDGTYACSRARLARDIRQDPGLYLFCLKELSQRMPSSDHTPLELFFRAPLEWISEIINSAPSHHNMESLKSFQANRMKETMIAAVTSEYLSPAVTIDPELGYTCSLIRQIGLSLAAWNYASEYERALSRANSSYGLDSAVKDLVGFSPTALGITFAREWRLCSEIQDALRSDSESNGAFAQSSRLVRYENPSTKLRKICTLGEQLARAMHAGSHYDSTKDIDHVHHELIRHLGSDALKKISQTARERLLRYCNYDLHMPAVASTEDLKRAVAATLQADEWKKQNTHLAKLSEDHRSKLEIIYRQLTVHDIARDAIRQLVKEVIPEFGFSGGYVYLYSPKQNSLSASLSIGEPSKASPETIRLGLASSQKLTAYSAYALKSALHARLSLPEGSADTVYAGRIGITTPIGVLYLEGREKELAHLKPDALTCFKAIQLCLAAALHAN